MKKLLLSILVLLFYNAICVAQCDKKLVIIASKTEYLDAVNAVERTVEEKTVIEINQPTILIMPGDKKMTATIISATCNWEIPFIEGKTTFIVTFSDDQGNTMNATLIIEGREGKVALSVQTEGRPGSIRVPIDKFGEKI